MLRLTIMYCCYLTLFIAMTSCSSPSKAFENRDYEKALRLASLNIKKGKKEALNYTILEESSDILIEIVKNSNQLRLDSENVENWIKAQDEYYKTLEKIGKANIESNGYIDDHYNDLCDAKMELDFRIVEHYYQEGERLVRKSESTGEKVEARKAYTMFEKCIEYGGAGQFTQLSAQRKYAVELGTIYYRSWGFSPVASFWYKPMPHNADFEPDCLIKYNITPITFSESTSSRSETNSKRIQTGTETYIDTAGISHTEPIYEQVQATIETRTTELSASAFLYRNVTNATGQCPLNDWNTRFTAKDSYEEVKISGDERALYHLTSEKSGEPAFFRSNLEREVERKISDSLR